MTNGELGEATPTRKLSAPPPLPPPVLFITTAIDPPLLLPPPRHNSLCLPAQQGENIKKRQPPAHQGGLFLVKMAAHASGCYGYLHTRYSVALTLTSLRSPPGGGWGVWSDGDDNGDDDDDGGDAWKSPSQWDGWGRRAGRHWFHWASLKEETTKSRSEKYKRCSAVPTRSQAVNQELHQAL